MPRNNEIWTAKVLNMEVNPNAGPDLIDGEKAVEVKFDLLYDGKYSHRAWKILGHQLRYDEIFPEIYWAFGFYTLDREVGKIGSSDTDLEKKVLSREVYVVQWNWAKRFPVYHEVGRNHDNYISFPKFRLLPKTICSFAVDKGKLFFTEGVEPKRFEINTKLL